MNTGRNRKQTNLPLQGHWGKGDAAVMKWCLMSSDVSWHIRDKLWPMPKHGSIYLYVHGNQKARYGRTAQDVHLDSHTAPELWTRRAQRTTFNTLDNWGYKTPPNQKEKDDRKVKRVMARNTHNALGYICNIAKSFVLPKRRRCKSLPLLSLHWYRTIYLSNVCQKGC